MDSILNKKKHNRIAGIGEVDRAEGFCHGMLSAHCDGALKSGDALHAGLGIAGGITELARKAVLNNCKESQDAISLSAPLDAETRRNLLAEADSTNISFSLSGARIWLQPVNSRKLALQWVVPANVRRNCKDLIDNDKLEFVLRLYRHSEQALKWKASHRTLEFPVDISRRKCYIKLEQAGGRFNAELGVKLGDGRYVFLARSGECNATRVMPDIDGKVGFDRYNAARKDVVSVPSAFRAEAIENYGLAPECDYHWLDLQAESQVRAVYTDFIFEGPRVFRNRPAVIAASVEERNLAYNNRIAEYNRPKAAVAVAVNEKPAVSLTIERIDALVEKKPVSGNSVKIKYPPAVQGYNPSLLTREQALRYAVIPYFCQRENIVQVEHYNLQELEKVSSRRRRKTVHVKSTRELTEAIKSGKLSEQAEIVLRGKVKPGRRVRVGGLLIETQKDGSFCVACVIRNGRLFVPVEEVSAVCVE